MGKYAQGEAALPPAPDIKSNQIRRWNGVKRQWEVYEEVKRPGEFFPIFECVRIEKENGDGMSRTPTAPDPEARDEDDPGDDAPPRGDVPGKDASPRRSWWDDSDK